MSGWQERLLCVKWVSAGECRWSVYRTTWCQQDSGMSSSDFSSAFTTVHNVIDRVSVEGKAVSGIHAHVVSRADINQRTTSRRGVKCCWWASWTEMPSYCTALGENCLGSRMTPSDLNCADVLSRIYSVVSLIMRRKQQVELCIFVSYSTHTGTYR